MTTQTPALPHIDVHVEPTERKTRARAERSARLRPGPPLAGTLWFGGWLFTLGLLKLVWWKALLALIVWPYFLGLAMH